VSSHKIKKTLLIFFGELRTFEYVVPFLNKLNKVDIVLSTWNESKIYDSSYIVNESLITKVLPQIKQYHIADAKEYNNHHPSWKMYWHWKNAINNIENPDEYENVILHRCDMISNWETILDVEIEKDTLYCHHGSLITPYFKKGSYDLKTDGVWINDYYFFGKFDIMKKFVNLFNKENYPTPHIGIWEVISENNIKFQQFILNGCLIKDSNIEKLKQINLANKKFTEFSVLTGPS
jgi:hypothetical protein